MNETASRARVRPHVPDLPSPEQSAAYALTIEGRNLHRVHDYLDTHRLAAVRETDSRTEFEPDKAEVVERITVEPLKS